MGLCIQVKKTKDEFDIGYGGYFSLRYHIIKSIDEKLADIWKKSVLGEISQIPLEDFEKLWKLGLTDFLFHSDCDGLLGRRKVKRTLVALEKINFINEDWKKEFEELKNILRIAIKNKSSIKYL